MQKNPVSQIFPSLDFASVDAIHLLNEDII